MLTYPIPGSTLVGNATVAQVLAFLKSPTELARRFADIMADHNFLSHAVLRGRYRITGGALVYLPDEVIQTDERPETIAPGGEYPLVTLNADAPQIVAAMKKGFGTEVTDEEVGRLLLDPVERAIQMLAYTMVSRFDSIAMAAIASAVTQSVSGGSWTGATATSTIVGNVEAAKAAIRAQRRGYRATTIVLTGAQYAAIAPSLLSVLPREAGNPVLSGSWPNILGLDWVTSDDLPAGWRPTVLDADNLGGIGHEDIPSPEYVALSAINPANGAGVEVARYRERHDSTRIQVRKADVPVVRNPGAACEITGTGL